MPRDYTTWWLKLREHSWCAYVCTYLVTTPDSSLLITREVRAKERNNNSHQLENTCTLRVSINSSQWLIDAIFSHNQCHFMSRLYHVHVKHMCRVDKPCFVQDRDHYTPHPKALPTQRTSFFSPGPFRLQHGGPTLPHCQTQLSLMYVVTNLVTTSPKPHLYTMI